MLKPLYAARTPRAEGAGGVKRSQRRNKDLKVRGPLSRISVWAVNINTDMAPSDGALLALYLAPQVKQDCISVICLEYCHRSLYRQAPTAQSLFYSLLSTATLCSPFITAAKDHARWQSYARTPKRWQAVVELLSESPPRAGSKRSNRTEAR